MKSQRLKKFVRWSVCAVVTLVILLALFILEENIRGRIMLARYKAELRAKGEKLSLAELDLPQPPIEGNGAPALLEAADELRALSVQSPWIIFGLHRWQVVEPGHALVLTRQEYLEDKRQPVSGRSQRGRGVYGTNTVEVRKADWSELAAELDTARSAIQKAENATKQPVLAVALSYQSPMELLVRHTDRFRIAAQWLAANALLALHERRFGDASVDVAGIARIARSFQSDRLTFSQGIGARTGELGLRVTWEALQSVGWNDEECRQWQQLWQGEDGLAATVASAEVGRALALQQWARLAHHWPTLKELREGIWSFDGLSWWEELRETARTLLWRLAFVPQDELRLLQQWQRAIDIVRTAQHARDWTTTHSSFESDFAIERRQWRWYDNWRYLLSGALGPGTFDLNLRIQMQFETLRHMTLAALALKRYELSHGGLPSRLEELIPEYLPAAPPDYMDGQSLRYRKRDGSFVLYSVGENGVDDGGDARPPESNPRARALWQGRDAVWPRPASER